VPVADLAGRLLSLTEPPDAVVARRLVAAILGRRLEEIPDPIGVSLLQPADPQPDRRLAIELADFAVVDLETTGLAPLHSRIIEIGAVRVAGLRVVERFETRVDPGVPIPASITALTGIDAEMLAGAPRPAEALGRFRRWLACLPDAPFVAHNAPFDAGFVRTEFARLGWPPPSAPVLCTARLARRLLPDQRSASLDALSLRFGIRNRARHRALGDAEAAAGVLCELLRLARGRAGLETLGELLDFCAMPTARARKRLAAAPR
ncbi:MAG: 3'-5' exonuclease, partial [Deltaproteobacteria bacterium]